MGDTGQLSASLEDYLETILLLVQSRDEARPRDIARRLDVRAASVTGALRTLVRRGLVRHAPYGGVTLTGDGERAAAAVLRRHEGLRRFFRRVLLLDEGEAEACACRVEHAVPGPVARRFADLADYAERERLPRMRWSERNGFRAVRPRRSARGGRGGP